MDVDAHGDNIRNKVVEASTKAFSNFKEAFRWFSLASTQGHIDAQNKLGQMYSKGIGVKRDYAQSIKWYKLAASKNSALA